MENEKDTSAAIAAFLILIIVMILIKMPEKSRRSTKFTHHVSETQLFIASCQSIIKITAPTTYQLNDIIHMICDDVEIIGKIVNEKSNCPTIKLYEDCYGEYYVKIIEVYWKMSLADQWYQAIANNIKTIEVRQLDEKRKHFRGNHWIIFTNQNQRMIKTINNVKIYDDIETLLKTEPIGQILPGYEYNAAIKIYQKIYPNSQKMIAINLI